MMIFLLQAVLAQPSVQNLASASDGQGSALLTLHENFPFTNLTSQLQFFINALQADSY